MWPSPAVLGALVALVGWAFWQRYRFLAASPYPLGVDGYFYPIQLRSLLATGHLYYPSAPLTLWLMAPLAALTDPIVGAKLGAALGSALAAVPIYFLGRRISGDRACGLLAAALVAASAESFYLTVEFVKNGIALTVASTYLVFLLRALERPTRGRIAAAAIALLATLLAHKLALILALVLSLPPIYVRVNASDRRRWLLVGAVGLGLALAALGLLAPRRFVAAGDLGLIGHAFTGHPDFTLPALDVGRGHPLRFGYEVAIAAGLAALVVALAIAGRRWPGLRGAGRDPDRALGLGAAVVALVIACPWLDVADPQGLGFRLRLLAFVVLALCGAAAAGRLLGRLSPLARTALVVGFAVGWLVSRPPATREGLIVVKPHMQAAVLALEGVVPPGDVVICPERHIVFMIAWYTDTAVRLRPDSVPEAHRWRLLPSALISPALQRAIDQARRDPPPGLVRPRGLHPRHRNGVVVMPEATWRYVLGLLPPRARASYQAWHTI